MDTTVSAGPNAARTTPWWLWLAPAVEGVARANSEPVLHDQAAVRAFKVAVANEDLGHDLATVRAWFVVGEAETNLVVVRAEDVAEVTTGSHQIAMDLSGINRWRDECDVLARCRDTSPNEFPPPSGVLEEVARTGKSSIEHVLGVELRLTIGFGVNGQRIEITDRSGLVDHGEQSRFGVGKVRRLRSELALVVGNERGLAALNSRRSVQRARGSWHAGFATRVSVAWVNGAVVITRPTCDGVAVSSAVDRVGACAARDRVPAVVAKQRISAVPAKDPIGAVVASNDVVSIASGENVRMGAAADRVSAGMASDSVAAVSARHRVGSTISVDPVITISARQNVSAAATGDHIVVAVAVDRVVSAVAVEVVVARKTRDRVVSDAARDRVVAVTTSDRVVAPAANDRVVPVASVDRVISSSSTNDIVAAKTVDDVPAARPDNDVGSARSHETGHVRRWVEGSPDSGRCLPPST